MIMGSSRESRATGKARKSVITHWKLLKNAWEKYIK